MNAQSFEFITLMCCTMTDVSDKNIFYTALYVVQLEVFTKAMHFTFMCYCFKRANQVISFVYFAILYFKLLRNLIVIFKYVVLKTEIKISLKTIYSSLNYKK